MNRFSLKTLSITLFLCFVFVGVQTSECQSLYNSLYEESPEFQGITSVKQIDHLFYDNEARDLLAHYKNQKSTHTFIEQIHNISKKLSLEINKKNRSKRLLHVMRVLNFFHDEEKEVRFAIIEHLSVKNLYDLIFLWRQAIYTSSFNGVFDKIKARIENSKDQRVLFSILQNSDFEGLNAFVQSCSAYNRLPEFFEFFSLDQQASIMKSYATKMDATKNYYYAMAWVEIMLHTTNRKLLSFMEDYLIKKINQSNFNETTYEHDFEKTHYVDREQFYEPLSLYRDLSEVEFYGLIMGAYYSFDSLRNFKLTDRFVRHAKKWVMDNPSYIPSSYRSAQLHDLPNQDSKIIQRHFYYGDGDGWATWVAFLRKHKRIPNDQVIQHQNYVKILRNKSKLVIYANKPGKRVEGQESIDIELDIDQNRSQVFVHRGHSYHLHRGLAKISKNTKLAILGSCGGYNDLHAVLKRSLDVHVVISKGKGTYWVNRAILDVINNDIASGSDIDWFRFRDRVIHILKNQHHIKDRYQDMIDIFNEYYVLPNENVGLAMLNRAIHLLNDGQVDAIASVKK